jgi:hypothetical protein
VLQALPQNRAAAPLPRQRPSPRGTMSLEDGRAILFTSRHYATAELHRSQTDGILESSTAAASSRTIPAHGRQITAPIGDGRASRQRQPWRIER